MVCGTCLRLSYLILNSSSLICVSKKQAMLSIFIIILLLLLPLLISFFKKTQETNLPPGPFQWPIVGNIPNVLGKNPHIIVSNLAITHGPLISLKIGTRLLIVGSNRDAAVAILKTNDRDISARYTPKATPIEQAELNKYVILWAPACTPEWKSLRSVWRTELFGKPAMSSQCHARENKVVKMMEFLEVNEGKHVNIGDLVFATVFNTLGNHCFSMDVMDMDDVKLVREWKETMSNFTEAATTPLLGDLYPMFGGFDPTSQKNKSMRYMKKFFRTWEEVIKRRRGSDRSSIRHGDFLEYMLTHEFSDEKMLFMLLEIFPAFGNLKTTCEWAMAELIKNKDAMNKLREELHREIGSSSCIYESQISQLTYLNACVKETLRLHPPIAFTPHLASSTCEIMNYTVPEGSLVMMNLWALGHDPNTWKNPFSFNPDRFVDSDLDFHGRDFEYLPFGAGRRMCPGIQYATKQVHYILAALVHFFDWSLPNNVDSSELDMNEKYGVPIQKEKPLVLVPHKKY